MVIQFNSFLPSGLFPGFTATTLIKMDLKKDAPKAVEEKLPDRGFTL